VIWVGTDDGNIQLTRDGGTTWTNVVGNVPGVGSGTWISQVEASPHDEATAFVTVDDHRRGNMGTHVYRTTDHGASWQSIVGEGLEGFAHVVRQDLVNPDLLFVGTEFGLYLSVDGGQQWARFTGRIPRVPVHDIKIHPRESDLIVGSHGRGIYILDDLTPLRALTTEVLDSSLALLPSRPATMPTSWLRPLPRPLRRSYGPVRRAATPCRVRRHCLEVIGMLGVGFVVGRSIPLSLTGFATAMPARGIAIVRNRQ